MTRQFDSGATRDTDTSKLDYEGFLSPVVLRRFAEYMHECRLRNIPKGQTVRSSDNWQKGMPIDSYMKSLIRHVMEAWTLHRAGDEGSKSLQDALCAIIFNVQGYLFERLKNGGRNFAGNSGRPLSELSQSESVYAEVETVRDVSQERDVSEVRGPTRANCSCESCQDNRRLAKSS